MSTKLIDLNNLAAIIRELKEVVDKLSPEDLETLEVLLDDDAMTVLNQPIKSLKFHDLEDVRAQFEDSGK